jgi:hypothetical protein
LSPFLPWRYSSKILSKSGINAWHQYLANSFSVFLENLTISTGCLNVDGSKPLLSFSIQNNSDGTAGWDNPPIFC